LDIHLKNKHLEQVDKIKYLFTIIHSKFKFTGHTNYITDRCTKLINALSMSARISCGLRHEAQKQYTMEQYYHNYYRQHQCG